MGFGKIVNFVLIVFAVLLAITAIVAVGIAADCLVKLGKKSSANDTGNKMPGPELHAPPRSSSGSKSEQDLSLGRAAGTGKNLDGPRPDGYPQFPTFPPDFPNHNNNKFPTWPPDSDFQNHYDNHKKNVDNFNKEKDDAIKFSCKLVLGISVVLFLTSIVQIIFCTLSLFNTIRFLIWRWTIVNALCTLVYLVLFSVLCYYFAGVERGELSKCLIAFSAICSILTIAAIVFFCLNGNGEGKVTRADQKAAPSTTTEIETTEIEV